MTAAYGTQRERKNAYRILVGKLEEKMRAWKIWA
jgi:hypothetical protein